LGVLYTPFRMKFAFSNGNSPVIIAKKITPHDCRAKHVSHCKQQSSKRAMSGAQRRADQGLCKDSYPQICQLAVVALLLYDDFGRDVIWRAAARAHRIQM
jgi:hypothetical protein